MYEARRVQRDAFRQQCAKFRLDGWISLRHRDADARAVTVVSLWLCYSQRLSK
jgi:hypothetical protein